MEIIEKYFPSLSSLQQEQYLKLNDLYKYNTIKNIAETFSKKKDTAVRIEEVL